MKHCQLKFLAEFVSAKHTKTEHNQFFFLGLLGQAYETWPTSKQIRIRKIREFSTDIENINLKLIYNFLMTEILCDPTQTDNDLIAPLPSDQA